jgi:hypothetical protein
MPTLPKVKPIDVVQHGLSAVEAGRDEVLADEVLADDMTRRSRLDCRIERASTSISIRSKLCTLRGENLNVL